MNVFIIPSWYPSCNNPLPGIFFRDQAMAMAFQYKNINIGISSWGQNDDRLLLWSKSPFTAISKLLKKPKSEIQKIRSNLIEYFSPAYTWSSRISNGNMNQIIKANLSNLEKFESAFGKTDIIHAHVGYPAGHIAKILTKIHKNPYVITEHMSPFPHAQFLNQQNELNYLLREAYDGASQNICVSRDLEQNVNYYKIEKTTTIPNLIDEDFFTPAIKPQKHKTFTFFSMGRMVPQKGIDILLKAFSRIDKEAILRIGGRGEFLDRYKKLAIDLGIDNKVKWLGELNKSSALEEYQHCDSFVLPSRHESMGVVFAEAMACGKPVIASICGGPEEFIMDDCGYLVEPENETDLVKTMNKMIVNHKTFDSKNIRDHAKSRFSKKIVCDKIYKVYKEAINSYRF